MTKPPPPPPLFTALNGFFSFTYLARWLISLWRIWENRQGCKQRLFETLGIPGVNRKKTSLIIRTGFMDFTDFTFFFIFSFLTNVMTYKPF